MSRYSVLSTYDDWRLASPDEEYARCLPRTRACMFCGEQTAEPWCPCAQSMASKARIDAIIAKLNAGWRP